MIKIGDSAEKYLSGKLTKKTGEGRQKYLNCDKVAL